MKNIIKNAFLILFLVSSQVISAQYGAQKKGDYYFSQFSYAKAIPFYETMIKGDFNTSHAH